MVAKDLLILKCNHLFVDGYSLLHRKVQTYNISFSTLSSNLIINLGSLLFLSFFLLLSLFVHFSCL